MQEAAVVAAPDELSGEVARGVTWCCAAGWPRPASWTGELQQLVKTEFAAHAYPRRVHFVPELPKTASGKVQRYLLRRS